MKREEAIKDLDIIRFNPHWDELVNEEYWQELMEMAITTLQNQPVWIPVSERLPEELVPVNVTWINRNPEPYYKDIKDVPFANTAVYDQDKVVQQLEERTAFLKDCTKYGNKTAEQQSKSYDTMMMYEVKDLVDDLLEIVKAGGSDGN